jgi:hypothetical protein
MAEVAPELAVEQVREWLDAGTPEMRQVAFDLLGQIHTTEALKLALERAGEPQTASEALNAIQGIFSPITNYPRGAEHEYLAAPVWNDLMAVLDLPPAHWATSDPEQSRNNRSILGILAALRDQKTPVVAAVKAAPADLEWIRWGSTSERSDVSQWLKHHFPAERGRRLALDPAALAGIRKAVYAYEYIEVYHWMLPGEAAKALDALLANRAHLRADQLRELLRTAVHCGRTELVEEMIAAYRLTDEERELYREYGPDLEELVETGYFDLQPLLEAGTQAGLDEYLRLLDQRLAEPPPPVHLPRSGYTLYAYPARSLELHYLFPRYPKPFFDRVIRLLQSPRLIDRQRARAAMRTALHWEGVNVIRWDNDFDFGGTIGHRRDRLMAQLLPALQRMAQMESEVEIRAEILRQIGLDLEGEAGPAWYPELVDAVGSLAPEPLTYNAMRLAELLVRDIGPTSAGLDRDFGAANRAQYLELFFTRHSGENDR